MRDLHSSEPFAERRRSLRSGERPPVGVGAAATSRAAAAVTERETELRRAILAVLLIGLLATLAELLLPFAPSSGWWPAVALVSVMLGLVACMAALLLASAFTIRLLRVAMVPLVVVGLVGLWLVHQGGVLLFLDLYTPFIGLRPLFGTLAVTIPAFAPPAVILLGLLGLVFTYRHPLLG